MSNNRVCDVCGKHIGDWPDRHQYHEKDCPNWAAFFVDNGPYPIVECKCDLIAHHDCCPMCNEESTNAT